MISRIFNRIKMAEKKLLAFLLLPIIILGFLSSCTSTVVEPLRIVSSPWPGYEPIYLARDLGYLSKEKFKISEMPSSNISWESFSNGSADVATLTLDETLKLISAGRKLRILAVMDVSNGADAVVAKPSIKSLGDLKGKRIGMINIPLGVYMLSRLLDVAGLKQDDVKIIIAPEDLHEKFYSQDKVDAVITFDPFKTKLIQKGAHVIFDSSKIPNEILDVLVVSEKNYNERRSDLCELGRQWYRTLDYIAENKNTAYQKMGRRIKSTGTEYQEMMGGLLVPDRADNKKLLSGGDPALFQSAKRLYEIMLKQKLVETKADIISIIDPNYQECTK